ncbi:MAG TPA: class I SAM-dependent methyltransferase [Candidatus Nanoarchaeia archaeon]|nr:class I SAM-dependent methyltransferase [Candidatus Nanoarchaeia archaeon]
MGLFTSPVREKSDISDEMNYKRANQEVYETYAKEFEIRTKGSLTNQLLKNIGLFIKRLPGREVLDLGSGPGRDALLMKERGLNPLCFDISRKMIELCKQKGLRAQIGDLEALPFKDNAFDGVLACTSLLHMPKSNLPAALSDINRILKSRGQFYLNMKEGDFEGFIESDKYPGMERFFSLYSDEELRRFLSNYFKIECAFRESLGDATFLGYLCESKK